jgi:hypothetical protein
VDGDHKTLDCLTLPGTFAPERVVFEQLRANNWSNLPERFGIGAGTLLTILEDTMLEPDHHKWNRIIGDQVRKSSTGVWEILANEWGKSCLPEDRKGLADGISEAIDKGTDGGLGS